MKPIKTTSSIILILGVLHIFGLSEIAQATFIEPGLGDFDTTGTWWNATPMTPGPISIQYDYRPWLGEENLLEADLLAENPVYISLVEDALDMWSDATGGKLEFNRTPLDFEIFGTHNINVITIGLGDLSIFGEEFTSAPGGVLGVGGASGFSSGLGHGVAWLDFAENWDTQIGNGNPGGTIDFVTVMAHEIGHALGLKHVIGPNIMNTAYIGELTQASIGDRIEVLSLYGGHPELLGGGGSNPEPGTLVLFSIAILSIIGHGWRRRKQISISSRSKR